MRRMAVILLCLGLLPLKVRGAEQKYVALTFDDGPSGHYTQDLLDGLYDRGAKATFLLCGYRMAEFPELTRQIFEAGHEIGFHGYSHKTMKGMSRRSIAQELLDSEQLLPPGCVPTFLRPPGGNVSDPVRQVAEARGLCLLGWSVDPRDWATDDTAAIETAVLESIQDGDVVLLHDMSESSVQASLDIVDALLEDGFELVTVSELAGMRENRLVPGRFYRSFQKPQEK